ncbi:tetratricopeptide repeat protein [Paractinoplanes lichenicola]|uniref:Tetratricopeptide repeat protein n=1 Tax=Paractinoplanes lichenicola TaxID=2802976 RepID=A0ABS1VJP5_9ACTN|nr:tetratricopeptide repeat protein [Actinoplanes lichenicola]MBL7253977.1 tetratricopeptide repeat protein [Actinoplanes lichenicola]
MGSESTAGALLAAGNEAMLEAAYRTGDFLSAWQLLEGARRRACDEQSRVEEAAALTRLGMLAHFAAIGGDLARADWATEEQLFTAALRIQREVGDPAGAAESLFGLGLVHQVLRGDWTTAMPYYTEALALAESYADEMVRSEVHRHIGFFHVFVSGDVERGLRHLRMSQVLRERYGDPRRVATGTLALGEAELAAGNLAEALRLLREAVDQARKADLSDQRIGWAEHALGDAERAAA